MYVETVFTEIGQFCMLLRHGGGIDHERACLVFALLRNKVDILFVVYLCSFRNQTFCQFARRTVVARYCLSFREEIAYQSAHADAADSQKIDILKLHPIKFQASPPAPPP